MLDNFIHKIYSSVDKLKYLGELKMEDVTKTWQSVKDIIKVDILEASFNTWIEPIVPVDMTVDKLVLEVPFESSKQIILSRYLTLIQNALVFITQREYDVEIIVNRGAAGINAYLAFMDRDEFFFFAGSAVENLHCISSLMDEIEK